MSDNKSDLLRSLSIDRSQGQTQSARSPIGVSAIAIAIVASQTSAAINTAYNLPGGETLTYRAMAERVFESMGRRPRIVSIPLPLWQLGLRLALPILPGATAAMGARMAQDLVFDDSQARSDLDWQPRRFAPRFQTS